MHEAQWPTRVEDPGGGELVRRGCGGPGVNAGETGGEPKVGLAQHGRRSCQVAGGYGEAIQPLHDRVRDRARGEPRDAGRGCRRRRDTLLSDRANELLHEERHAPGHLMARPRESRLHFGAESQPHELGHRMLAQRCEHEDLGRRVGGERCEQRRTLGRLGRPCRRDDRDRQFLESSPEVVQEAQRGLVSPVGIVDAEQDRGAPGEVRAQPVEPVEDRERRVEQRVGCVILRRPDAEQRGRTAGRAREKLRTFRRRRRDERRFEQLADEAVCEVSLQFRAARAQRRQAELATMPPCGQNQARLADARRSLQQKQRTTPGDRCAQALTDLRESGVSLQKHLPGIDRGHEAAIVPPPRVLGPPPQKQVVSHVAKPTWLRDARRRTVSTLSQPKSHRRRRRREMLHHHAIEATAPEPLQCPSCGLPATITDRFTLHGSPGPVEHVRLVCVAGHRFTPPISRCQVDHMSLVVSARRAYRTRERVRSR